MEHAELEETVKGLYKILMQQQGQIAAQQLALDTVVSSLSQVPTFLDRVSSTLPTLTPHVRNNLEEESLLAFDSTVWRFEQCVDAIAGR